MVAVCWLQLMMAPCSHERSAAMTDGAAAARRDGEKRCTCTRSLRIGQGLQLGSDRPTADVL
jgi:hypothetical protein